MVLAAVVSCSEPGGRAEREGGESAALAGVLRAAEDVDDSRDRRRREVIGAVSADSGSDREQATRCMPVRCERRRRAYSATGWSSGSAAVAAVRARQCCSYSTGG